MSLGINMIYLVPYFAYFPSDELAQGYSSAQTGHLLSNMQNTPLITNH